MLLKRSVTAALLLVGQPVVAAPVAAEQQVTLKLKNGDTLKGVLEREESTDATTILLHPVLGRLSIPAAADPGSGSRTAKRITSAAAAIAWCDPLDVQRQEGLLASGRRGRCFALRAGSPAIGYS